MGELADPDLDLTMFNSLKKQTKDEAKIAEKAPLLLQRKPPRDWLKLTYVILFLHGIGHLLPWNMFITAHEYFENRFTCHHEHNSSLSCHGFQNSFENYFAVGAMSSVAVSSALNIYIQSKIHFKYRMFSSLIMMLLLFIFTTIMVKVPSKTWVDGFFVVSLLTIVVMNVFSGLFQSSTFGFAGVLPQEYTAAVMGGQAWAGLFSAIARIISTAAVQNSDITLSALIYFLTAAIVVLICLLSFFLLLKLEFVKYHLEKTSVKSIKEKQESVVQTTVNVKEKETLPFFKIFQKIFVYAISVFLVFCVTLALFPAVLSSVKSSVSDPQATIWTGSLFDALVCFLLFNAADFVGRYLSNWFAMPGQWKYLLLLFTVLRIVFIPLYLLCNVKPRGDNFPVQFHQDFIPVIFTLFFGLSNGFFASLCMVSAPSCVELRYRETASVIMTWFLTLGLLAGAGFSFLLTYIVTV